MGMDGLFIAFGLYFVANSIRDLAEAIRGRNS